MALTPQQRHLRSNSYPQERSRPHPFWLLPRLQWLMFRVCGWLLLCGFGLLLFAAPAEADVWHHLDGNPADVRPALSGPAYNLGGGGTDVDRALQWMVNQVRPCQTCAEPDERQVDMVVLRFLSDRDQTRWQRSGTVPGLEANYLGYHELLPSVGATADAAPRSAFLQGLDSIETFVFSNPARQDADRADIAEAIAQAEVVFFAGGDQCRYVRNFKNTALERAIEAVEQRGGAIGGTSAGAMIQGEWVFNACSDTLTSEGALADPYEDILFTNELFDWRPLRNTIIDTHFYQRDRMGRALAFVARLLRDGITEQALAIAIDEDTSLVVNSRGRARVMSDDADGSVYLIRGNRQPDRCEPQQPLSLRNYRVWRVRDGKSVNLKRLTTGDSYRVSVDDGALSPTNPYRSP